MHSFLMHFLDCRQRLIPSVVEACCQAHIGATYERDKHKKPIVELAQ
jgi:hypothetical protein